jgi:hypothetical protein
LNQPGDAEHKPAEAACRVTQRAGAMMNHSIYSADRMTHLKVVIVALVAGIFLAGFGISARINGDEGYSTQTARVIKAGAPVTVSSSNAGMVR